MNKRFTNQGDRTNGQGGGEFNRLQYRSCNITSTRFTLMPHLHPAKEALLSHFVDEGIQADKGPAKDVYSPSSKFLEETFCVRQRMAVLHWLRRFGPFHILRMTTVYQQFTSLCFHE